MPDYFEQKFSVRAVEHIKEITDAKNRELKYNNLSVEYDTRWIGTCGELTFREWLNKRSLYYEYCATATTVDEYDFILFGDRVLTVDVKTVGADAIPPKHYACNVAVSQYNKMDKKKQIDILVFARFIKPENKCVLLGWISFEGFKRCAIFKKAGSHVNIKSDMYECKISDLNPLKDSFDYETKDGKVYVL